MVDRLSPELLVRAYSRGLFPMAEGRDDPNLYWVDPEERGLLPLDAFHVPRRLARVVRSDMFDLRINTNFAAVIKACAETVKTGDRASTWINDEIVRAYNELHQIGIAHSVECWQNGHLVGGLYGLSLGAGFFGESMFSRAENASKVALVHLAARLRLGGYILLDCQFWNDHLAQFGLQAVERDIFREQLEQALDREGDFGTPSTIRDGAHAVAVLKGAG